MRIWDISIWLDPHRERKSSAVSRRISKSSPINKSVCLLIGSSAIKFSNISFILYKPQLSENIGACARALKNFNFKKLTVVNPKPSFPNDKIFATSVGAKEIIKNTAVLNSLEPAIRKIDYLIATTSRPRNKNIKHIKLNDLKKINYNKKICLLIGPEGDFSDKEKEFIYDNKFIKVSLGNTILRTETAIISVLSILNELIEYE